MNIKIFQVAFKRSIRQADVAEHQRGHGAMPATNVKPAATVAGAIADDMDVHVDGFQWCCSGILRFSGHGLYVYGKRPRNSKSSGN